VPVYFGPSLVLLDRLAAGGMGEVYRARQVGTGGFQKTVAVKRILPQYAARNDFAQMFQQEMNLCAKLQHPNIVQVFSNGREGGYLYLVMEFVNGRSVAELIVTAKRRKLRIPPEVSCFIIAEAAQGLAYAHSLKDDVTGAPLHIVHRDVSPQNIMLGFGGEVKIVDFGIAKAADRIEKEKSGELKGKVPYAAPEYLNGKEPDQRADIFGLGVVFYELLSQRPLFAAETPYDTIKNVLEKPIPSLVEQYPDIRFELESTVLRALERDPRERIQDAGEFYRAIAVFMNKAYPNFTRAEFVKALATLLVNKDDASVARLRDLYGYAKEVPAQLVNAATNAIQDPAATNNFAQRLIRALFAARLLLAPLLALLLFLSILLYLKTRIPPALEAKPTEIGNLLTWLTPEYVEHGPAGKVTAWRDASWLENSAVQFAEDHQPSFLPDTVQGQPVVHFDGTGSFLIARGIAESLARAKGVSLLYVARLLARQGVPQTVWSAQSLEKDWSIVRGGFTFGTRLNLQMGVSPEVVLSKDSAALTTDMFNIYSYVLSAQRGTAYQNGVEVIVASAAGVIPFEKIAVFSLGQAYKEGKEADYLEGDLAELILYSKEINDEERRKVEQYLSRKYKIRLNTP
jgi:eukaryotic-like serine/threonine-protein kinase